MFRCSLSLNAIFTCQVTDKRSVEFVDRLSQIFEGRGELLGGETKPSRLVPTKLKDCERGRDGAVTQETTQDLPGGSSFVDFFTHLLSFLHVCLHHFLFIIVMIVIFSSHYFIFSPLA